MTLTRRAQQMREYLQNREDERVKYKLILADLDDDLYVEYLSVPGRLQVNERTNFFDLDNDLPVITPLDHFRSQAEVYARRNDPRPKGVDVPDDELAQTMDKVAALAVDEPAARELMQDLATEEARRYVVNRHGEFLASVEAEHQREAIDARRKIETAEAERRQEESGKARKTHAEAFCADLLDWARENYPLAGAEIEKFSYRLSADIQPDKYSFDLKNGTSVSFSESDPDDLRAKLYGYQYRMEQAAIEAAMTPEERALAWLEANDDMSGCLDDAPDGDTFDRLLTEAGDALASGGTLIMLFGPSGAAKSWMAALWAAQVVREGGRVIWLGYESNSGELDRRLKVLGLDDDERNRVRWHVLAFELDDEGRRGKYDRSMIERVKRIRAAGLPVLVVIDSFTAMLSAVNGGTQSASNDDQAVSRMYAVAQSLVTDDGVTVCMIDHGPGEKPRGSDRKKEEADLVYQLKMHGSIARDGHAAIICRKAPRNSARIVTGDTVAYLSAPDNQFRLTTEPPQTAPQKTHTEAREYVLEKMRENLAASPDVSDSDLWRNIPSSKKRGEVAADRARLISIARGE